ncbi:hypothetical protein NE865_07983 [Phthorimaea operculella]|nr:hypothetical protein NE865_07983 [Phthorimaea operculella]
MMKLRNVIVPLANKVYTPCTSQHRTFWEYVNMMFNKPDPDRIKAVGPDRACAEWVLRNGGKVGWASGKKLDDYNALPGENVKLDLVEIDGTDSSISHYGFSHLSGTKVTRIILHNNMYIDDRAMKELSHGKDTLTFVQVSKCLDVTDAGVKELSALHKLNTLVLFDLASVKSLDDCKNYIKSKLPNCTFKSE